MVCYGNIHTRIENSPTSVQMNVDIGLNEDPISNNVDKAFVQDSPIMTVLDQRSQHQSTSQSISFKSPCPTPQSKIKKVTSRQQHSVIFTKSTNKAQLEESAKVKELNEKIQQLQGKIKAKKVGQRNSKQVNMGVKSKTKANPKPKKTISKTTVSAKSKIRRNIKLDDSSSEDELPDMKDIVEDDYLDDVDPMKSFLGKGFTREASGSKDVCILCGDFGKVKEVWYRCCPCLGWIHSACSVCRQLHL